MDLFYQLIFWNRIWERAKYVGTRQTHAGKGCNEADSHNSNIPLVGQGWKWRERNA